MDEVPVVTNRFYLDPRKPFYAHAQLISFLINLCRSLCSVGGGRNVAAAASPVDVDVLSFRILLASELWLDTESVGTEVVTLCLEHVGWKILRSDTVVEGKGGREGWCWDTPESALGDDVTPAWLRLVDGLVEEVVEEQVLEVWVGAVGLGDVLQEDRADDAASTPHECDLWLLELPAVFFGGLNIALAISHVHRTFVWGAYRLHQHETLSVGDDLGSIECLFEVVENFLLVSREGWFWSIELLACTGTLLLERRQAAGKDCFSDESHGLTHVESIDGSPLSGTLLTCRVKNLLNER